MNLLNIVLITGALGQTAASAPDGLKPAELTVLSPQDYQVFQRESRTRGKILISGRAGVPCDSAEVSLAGKSLEGDASTGWQKIPVEPATGRFNAELPARAGGWYRFDIRIMKGGKELARQSVAHVGVGEVFVGAGQSNSTNCGGEGQLKPESGMVSTFDGSTWRIADDPQPGVHDKSTGGSFWPAFGDAMHEKYHVPIAVAVTGHGGTSIKQWQKDSELFNWMMTRIRQLGRGGFRALLWHQGEADIAMKSDEYARGLAEIIRASKAAAGWEFPWVVARVSYHNPEHPSHPSTREGQKMLWDAGVALEGPDTDTLTGANRDAGGKGIHFSPAGLRAHGKMWADKVSAYLDRVLEK